MATKITRDILESYLHCKFKAHLKLTGQQGIKTSGAADSKTTLTACKSCLRLNSFVSGQ